MSARSSSPRGTTSTRTRRSRAGARYRICWPRSARPTYSGWTTSCCTRRPDRHAAPPPPDGPSPLGGPFPRGGSAFPPSSGPFPRGGSAFRPSRGPFPPNCGRSPPGGSLFPSGRSTSPLGDGLFGPGSGLFLPGGAWMTPTRVRTLVIIAAICAIVAWLLLRQTYASLPPLPWTGVPALLLLAVAEAWSGRSLRSRLRGRGKPIPPIAVARMAALAKATSLAAAFVGGFAAGFLLYVASSLDKAAYRADAYVSAGTFGAAVILTLAALYLEYGCRVPTRQDEPGQPPDD